MSKHAATTGLSEEAQGQAHDAAVDFRVLSGNPTPTELAAVTAVLAAAIEGVEDSRRSLQERGQTAWQRAQRPIRTPLVRGAGTWRSFSA